MRATLDAVATSPGGAKAHRLLGDASGPSGWLACRNMVAVTAYLDRYPEAREAISAAERLLLDEGSWGGSAPTLDAFTDPESGIDEFYLILRLPGTPDQCLATLCEFRERWRAASPAARSGLVSLAVEPVE